MRNPSLSSIIYNVWTQIREVNGIWVDNWHYCTVCQHVQYCVVGNGSTPLRRHQCFINWVANNAGEYFWQFFSFRYSHHNLFFIFWTNSFFWYDNLKVLSKFLFCNELRFVIVTDFWRTIKTFLFYETKIVWNFLSQRQSIFPSIRQLNSFDSPCESPFYFSLRMI